MEILYTVLDRPLTDIPSEISEYRKNKILSKRAENDRCLSIAAALLLKTACADRGIDEKSVVYAENEYGKPYFKSNPELRFSLSHSKNMVILAIDTDEVGIDCETLERTVTESVAGRFFSKKEVCEFKDDLLSLWVTKESLCKLTGKGLSLGARDTDIPFYTEELETDGVFAKKFTFDGYVIVASAKHKITCVPEKIIL